MKFSMIAVLLIAGMFAATAQTRYFTKAGKVAFYSKAPMEAIEAHNAKGVSIVDVASGQVEFSVLMKGFEFEKAKMQEHFNEDYVESDTYSKAVFTGTLKSIPALSKDGVYNVPVSGNFTLHGVTRPQSATAVFTVKAGNISATSDFTFLLSDFNIKIPSLIADKISKMVKVVIDVPAYKPLASK